MTTLAQRLVAASGAVHCTIAAREEMEFIELASFTEEVQAVGAEESLQKLQLELLANPEKGDLIQGTGGFRKVRMNLPRRGKSGGARVIYLYLKIQNRILLVDIYKKTDRDTLSHEQKRWLKAFALILKS